MGNGNLGPAGGVIVEGAGGGVEIGREVRPVHRFFGRRNILLGDEVVDALLLHFF